MQPLRWLRKANSGKAHAAVTAWASKVPAGSLYLSAITLLELEMDVLRIERRDDTRTGQRTNRTPSGLPAALLERGAQAKRVGQRVDDLREQRPVGLIGRVASERVAIRGKG